MKIQQNLGTVAFLLTAVLVTTMLGAMSNDTQPERVQRPPADASAGKLKVLVLDGFSNHDWRQTTALIRAILDPTGLFEIDVSTAPPTAAAPGWDQWRPKFALYDAVIQTCNDIGGGPQWPAEVQTAFENYVRKGGGVFVFHAGNNAFPSWPAYDQIIGLGWRGKDHGWALSIADDGKIVRIPPGQGPGTGHGPRTDVVLTRLGEHPIHAGFPRRWKTPGLEIYHYARGPAKNVEVLSYAYDTQTKMNWPIEWTVTFGEGRIYTSTFGHVWKGDKQPVSMRCAGMQTLLVRALQWVAKRPVTFAVPADFPAEDRLSVRGEFAAISQ